MTIKTHPANDAYRAGWAAVDWKRGEKVSALVDAYERIKAISDACHQEDIMVTCGDAYAEGRAAERKYIIEGLRAIVYALDPNMDPARWFALGEVANWIEFGDGLPPGTECEPPRTRRPKTFDELVAEAREKVI